MWAALLYLCIPPHYLLGGRLSSSPGSVRRIWFSSTAWSTGDTTGGSDVWGYEAPDGEEYAIMGVRDGVAVVRVSDMSTIDVLQGPKDNDYYYHRDIKTYDHYAYVVNEMPGTNEGLMILDLNYLPDSVRFVGSYSGNGQVRSHNLSIDTETGYAYIVGQDYSGFRIVSLEDPESPVEEGYVATPDIHDVFARNDTLYVAEGSNRTFSIYDLNDKSNPLLLTRVYIPSEGYSHNIWPTDNGDYVLTTEETANRTVKVWDVRDLGNVQLVGEYLGGNRLAHNVHVKGSLAFISHYAYGITVVDLKDPANPYEIASFDTYGKNDGGGFYGCWGAYPFASSGHVYTSDIEGYLTVLKFPDDFITLRVANMTVGPAYVAPGAGEVEITAELFSTYDSSFSVTADVMAFDSVSVDMFSLLDDGAHHDGEANDNIWGGSWSADTMEATYHIRIGAQQDGVTVPVRNPSKIPFTTIGPIVYDETIFLTDTVANAGDNLILRVALKNEGSTTSATEVKGVFTSGHDCVTDLNPSSLTYGEIAAGETSVPSKGFLVLRISETCPSGTDIPVGVVISSEGNSFWEDSFSVHVEPEVSVAETKGQVPETYALHPNYPNPFNPITALPYDLPRRAHVDLTIYDILGRPVTTLVRGVEEPGSRSVVWDGTDDFGEPVSAGVYLYRISAGSFGQARLPATHIVGQAGDFVRTRKMILLR